PQRMGTRFGSLPTLEASSNAIASLFSNVQFASCSRGICLRAFFPAAMRDACDPRPPNSPETLSGTSVVCSGCCSRSLPPRRVPVVFGMGLLAVKCNSRRQGTMTQGVDRLVHVEKDLVVPGLQPERTIGLHLAQHAFRDGNRCDSDAAAVQ